MAKAQVVQQVKGPLTKVWAIVSDFAHVNKWVSDVQSLQVTGSGIGMVRHLILRDGSKCDEKLVVLDDKQHIVTYVTIETELAFKEYTATITVKALNPTLCEITWSSTFKPVGIDEKDAVNLLLENYPRYLRKIEELCNGGKK